MHIFVLLSVLSQFAYCLTVCLKMASEISEQTKNLTLVLLNKLRCHAHIQFSVNQITRSRFLVQIQILNGKQCRSWSVGFFRSQLIWIYTVCKSRTYPGSAGQGLISQMYNSSLLQLWPSKRQRTFVVPSWCLWWQRWQETWSRRYRKSDKILMN